MKLIIRLKNSQHDVVSIKEALKCFDCDVFAEHDKIAIATSSLVVGDIDLTNNDVVGDIWLRVKEFIDIINGSAIVTGTSMCCVDLENVSYEDQNGEVKPLNKIFKMYAVLPSICNQRLDLAKLIPLAIEATAVAKALRVYGRELNWDNLYRIYEVIKEDGWNVSHPDYDVFTGSANCSSVSGDDARHGYMYKFGTPKKTMHLADAQHLIKRTAREWLRSKFND